MRLSILIPIYNVEKYLSECLRSVTQMAMNEEELEIICINDGSTDKSLEILCEFQKEDNRIIIIDKVNSGYGDSLNQGLARATGKYIGIVESDDILISENMVNLLTIAEKNDVDVAKGNYNLFFESNNITYYNNFETDEYDKVFSIRDDIQVCFTAPSIWSGIYRRDLLVKNKIMFLPSPGAAYQDTSFMFKIWCIANRIILENFPIINYRQTNIMSSSNTSKNIFNIFVETEEMKSFLIRNCMSDMLPICVRAKYKSYAWNLNRLKGIDRAKFLIKEYLDLREDFYEGYIERKYWDTESWNIIFNILTDINKVILDNISCKDESFDCRFNIDKMEGVYILENSSKEFKLKLKIQNIKVIGEVGIQNEGVIVCVGNRKKPLLKEDLDILILIDKENVKLQKYVQLFESKFMKNYILI